MKNISWLIVALLTFGCAGKAKAPDASNMSVSQRMRSFSESLVALYPLVASQTEFQNPANHETINMHAQKMARESQGLFDNHVPHKDDADPSLSILANNLGRELSSASDAIKSGDRTYARVRLRNATSTCVQCHTRSSTGPQFGGLVEGEWVKKMSVLDQAEMATSLRQFDRALELYLSILENPKGVQVKSFEWEQAAQSALAISLRVKRDLGLAIKIVDKAIGAPNVVPFFRDDATEWRKILQGWQARGEYEKVKNKNLLVVARGLIDGAQNRFLYQGHRSNLVIYLRASGYLHEFLKTKQTSENAAEALYLLGLSYEGIEDASGKTMGPLYFRECIHRNPRTRQALACYDAYEENTYMGFLRGGGMSLSPEVGNYLEYLRKLSYPLQ